MIDKNILTSSLWHCCTAEQLKIWIYLILSADEKGLVTDSIPSMAQRCNISIEVVEEALKTFSSEDKYSRSKNDGGRRLRIDDQGVWLINHSKYHGYFPEKSVSNDESRCLSGATISSTESKRSSPPTPPSQEKCNYTLFPDTTLNGTVESVGTTTTDLCIDTNNSIKEIFEFWKKVMGTPRSRLSPERRRKIEGRLKDGRTVDEIKEAVLGCLQSPHNMGANDQRVKYNDIELICRNDTKLDRFIGINRMSQEEKAKAESDSDVGNGSVYVSPFIKGEDGKLRFDPSVASRIKPGAKKASGLVY